MCWITIRRSVLFRSWPMPKHQPLELDPNCSTHLRTKVANGESSLWTSEVGIKIKKFNKNGLSIEYHWFAKIYVGNSHRKFPAVLESLIVLWPTSAANICGGFKMFQGLTCHVSIRPCSSPRGHPWPLPPRRSLRPSDLLLWAILAKLEGTTRHPHKSDVKRKCREVRSNEFNE